ncbi:odorant receptor 94a-like [Rhagoletis pomonella]|uniref:odorant receptor 94a-like n=1 Tax=Rhagoletis pomonella TaxID=28610 RepID=UPI001783798B|nr:odorant receptor 94a-like [Rhagoletis pomonella]
MEYASEVLKIALSETVVVLKVLNIWRFAPNAAKLLHEWEQSEFFVPRTPQEQLMWRRAQNAYKKVLAFYRIWSIICVLLAFLSVVFMETPQLPVPYWIPIKHWREGNGWPLYLYDFVAVIFTCCCNIEIDSLQCYYLLHLTLCLRLIGLRMARLEDAGDDVEITSELLKLIQMQQRVKDMLKRCEEIVSLPFLVQIIFSSMIICFTAYYLQSVSSLWNFESC